MFDSTDSFEATLAQSLACDNRRLFLHICIPFLSALLVPAFGQTVSLGLAAGGSLTNAFQDTFEPACCGGPFAGMRAYSQSNDYVVGGMFEVHFLRSLSIEADGLYRELHLTQAEVQHDGTIALPAIGPVVTWEFPVMGKYRFHWSKMNPFVEAGPEFRTTGNLNANPSHYGVTAGLGIEMHVRDFAIAPMIRYTRWAQENYYAGSKADQVVILLGVSNGRSILQPLGSRVAFGAVVGTNLIGDFPNTSGLFLDIYQDGQTTYEVTGAEYDSGLHSLLTGPMVEVALPMKVYVEVDGVFHPLGEAYRTVSSDGTTQRGTQTRATTWEFPALAKYKFGTRWVKPFVEAGPSFRLPVKLDGAHLSTYAVTAGAGVEAHWRRLKISPSIRFTHWGSETGNPGVPGVSRNQVEFLTGFSL